MPKEFKEKCRVLKIPNKIRPYCFEEKIDIQDLTVGRDALIPTQTPLAINV